LTGWVKLHVVLAESGPDLSGSSGEAIVEKGTIQGIPFKTLKLAMQAHGQDLQYNTKPASEAAFRRVRATHQEWASGGWCVARTLRMLLVTLQAPPEAKKNEGVQLPKALTTQIELDDVDIAQLIARAKLLLGAPIPIPITGRMSLKADATIPLGALREVKRYAFHGDLTLTGASIYKVDFGRLAARIDLADGVLALTNLRGRLVNRPDGGPDNPPSATAPAVAPDGPLPPGGFRANLRAELSPPGRLSVKFDGNQLPLGELGAPFLPRPTPLSGLASFGIEAGADLGRATDPDAWAVSGRGESVQIRYQGATLDSLTLRFGLKGGVLDVEELAAKLLGRPLVAQGQVDLRPPREFRGTLDVTGWDIAALAALVPGAPRPSPVVGELTAHAEAQGTGSPWSLTTEGQGEFAKFQAGPVPLGEVPFRWTTRGDTVDLNIVEAHPFGGTVTGEAKVPIVAGKPTVGEVTFTAIDASRISAAMPGQDLKLTGKADGRVEFSIPPDISALEASVKLSAPDLTVQGIPAEQVEAAVQASKGVLKYELTADSLGGKVKVQGDIPLTASPAPAPLPIPRGIKTNASADGEIHAAGFALDQLWQAVGVTGVLAKLDGQGAVAANVRDVRAGPEAGLYAHGVVELRNLVWDEHPLGQLRGIVAKWPAYWRIEPLSGELLGGLPSGYLWGTTPSVGPKRVGFDLRVDNVSLKRASAFVPSLARDLDGSGTFLLAGSLDESLHATAEVDVAHARFAGLPLSEFKAPADLVFVPGGASGVLQVRQWSARLAGGQLRGDAWFHLGEDRAFRAETQLASLDIQMFTRLATDVRRPASGRVSGRVSLSGTDPAVTSGYRGRVVLDLDDASLVSLPIIRELDRFLGSARGGVFEDGDLTGTIANRHLFVEQLTLEGRLVQLHATGTVGFDGQLNLEVLINTNQIIPQTGMALVSLIPGLREVLGRSQEAVLRVANYLSNRLLKIRVTGTLKNPSVAIDPSVAVADSAVGFFAGVLKLPLGLVK
jgi:translocation and assembly module TamB